MSLEVIYANNEILRNPDIQIYYLKAVLNEV